MEKIKRKLLLAGVALPVSYLLFWPVSISPNPWTPQQAPAGYPYNTALRSIEKLAIGEGVGPEGISFDAQGRIYAGYADGRVMRFAADGSRPELLANTGGRPWGTHAGADGASVVVADAAKGLLRVRPGGVDVLATAAGNKAFGMTDDVDQAADGSLYFSDASWKYGLGQMMDDVFEHGHYGRLLRYDPVTGKARTLVDGLHVANGVALGPDSSYVLVSETLEYRVMRHWLKGERAGQSETFIDNLPGFPDNISYNGRDGYWLALYAPRDPGLDAALPHPWLLKLFQRIPASLRPKPPQHAWVLKLDMNGNVVANLQYKGDDAFFPITSVREVGDWLYFGSITYPAIGRMPLPAALKAGSLPPAR